MTKDEALKLMLKSHDKNERHRTVAETRYWCEQYKLLAQQAIEALANVATEDTSKERVDETQKQRHEEKNHG